MKISNRILIILGLVLLAGIFIAGCTQQSSQAPAQTPAPSETPAVQPSMANPASVNCGNLNGTTEIKTNPDGSQYGMCTFANGTTCEEWALFRGEGCKPANVTEANASSAAPSGGIANPASVNCGTLNGTTEIKTNPDGSQYGMCTFANGTSCEEWALFRGEGCKPGNATAPAQ